MYKGVEILKKKYLLMLSLIIAMLLTGCANVDYHIKYNEDKSAELTIKAEVDKSVVSKDDPIFQANMLNYEETFKRKLFKFEEIQTKDTIGFKASKVYKNADNLETDILFNNGKTKKIVTKKKGIFFDKYTIIIPYKLGNDSHELFDKVDEKVRTSVTIQHFKNMHTDGAKGKQIKWDLTGKTKGEIIAVYKEVKWFNVILLFLLVAFIGLQIIKRREKK